MSNEYIGNGIQYCNGFLKTIESLLNLAKDSTKGGLCEDFAFSQLDGSYNRWVTFRKGSHRFGIDPFGVVWYLYGTPASVFRLKKYHRKMTKEIQMMYRQDQYIDDMDDNLFDSDHVFAARAVWLGREVELWKVIEATVIRRKTVRIVGVRLIVNMAYYQGGCCMGLEAMSEDGHHFYSDYGANNQISTPNLWWRSRKWTNIDEPEYYDARLLHNRGFSKKGSCDLVFNKDGSMAVPSFNVCPEHGCAFLEKCHMCLGERFQDESWGMWY